MDVLKIDMVTKRFGGLEAVKDLSLTLEEGELLGIVGPNGSGKTTLLNLISGQYRPDQGAIFLGNKRIDGMRPYDLAKVGISRMFQITKLFPRMTVIENMLVPGLAATDTRSGDELTEKAVEMLNFLGIDQLRNEEARNLSGGQQRLLEFGRAMMLDPTVSLLDEPFAGVHPRLLGKIDDYIRISNEEGKAFVIVSHDIHSVLKLSTRLIVLNEGMKIADDRPERVRDDRRVIEAYLGE